MDAHRTQAIVDKDGTVTVRGVPYHEGERVEVIIRAQEQARAKAKERFALRESVIRYVEPCRPASDTADWDALRDEI